jgi:mannose/fructose/N-acetylgalactosamine-specific phosphotransferase system component IIB
MGVPPEMAVQFASVSEAAARWAEWNADPRSAILLTATVDAMVRLAAQVPALRTVNLGGVHQGAGRVELLRYLYLTADEARQLSALASRGVEITARDVPTASPVPLAELLAKQSVP